MKSLNRLLEIMATLRHSEDGCEWDRVQTFQSIAPYTIEEAYEVSDAIDRDDMKDLRGELGDLLLQVVFHSRIAEEAGHFDFQDVASSIANKMEARHPHIFGLESGAMDSARWEDVKANERRERGAVSAMDDVAAALPALMRAEKLQKRAARTGFDWPDPIGAEEKIFEELGELKEAAEADRTEEAGDLLFAVVNFLRKHDIAPEDALRQANAKFERRFRAMEIAAEGEFAALSSDQQEERWREVKFRERSPDNQD
ncbi:MAG: nucleoside triphosphate pyrophosphohydrolase [Pontixanthobacter sp.]